MNDTRALFERVLTDEPPLSLDLGPVVFRGRRVRRRRRLVAVAGTVAVLALGSLLAIPLADGMRETPPTSGRAQIPDDLTPLQRTIAEALVDASPETFHYDLSRKRWDDESLVTTVDDGRGRTRFAVRFWPIYRSACLAASTGVCTGTLFPVLPEDGSQISSYELAPGAYSELMTNGAENGPAVQVESTTYLSKTRIVREQPPLTGGRLSYVAIKVGEAYRYFLARQGAQPPEARTGGEAQRRGGTP